MISSVIDLYVLPGSHLRWNSDLKPDNIMFLCRRQRVEDSAQVDICRSRPVIIDLGG
jgi:hypothetical protein